MRFERNERNIRNEIEASITRSMHEAFVDCRPDKPHEPDFIAELVKNIPQDIFKSLNAYESDYQFAVSGIFCHQKPLAEFKTGEKAEIGDLLLVYIEENNYGVKKCNALLMQAKKINKVPYTVCSDEMHQLKLYEEWPTFTLKRADTVNGTEINVQPKTINTGAQYLLLQPKYDHERKVCCAYPDKELIPEKRLSEQIIDLMKFFTGRTFQIDNDEINSDDWSKLILNLINISGVSRFNRKNSGKVNANRQTTEGDQTLFEEINMRVRAMDNNDSEESGSCLLIYAKENKKENYQQELSFD